MSLFESSEPRDLPKTDHALPVGTRVDSFRITGLIGEGGFGVVYRAYDAILQREVALKEYLPATLATRAEHSVRVLVRSTRSRQSFEAGLEGFVNEARMLARFDHPALVKVHRFWEGNGTAYMAMPFYEGPTLKQYLADRHTPVDEAQLRAWLEPLLDAMETLHAADCLHRDIAPDNIVLTANGPVLLDFGAARQVIGDMGKGLTVMLKPGFAPVEQYGETSNTPQGPWTDIYALAAVISNAITGQPPASAVERVLDDHQPLLWRTQIGRYRQSFLHAIDAALAVRPEQRPQSVAQWREMFAVPPPPPVVPVPAASRKGVWIACGLVTVLLALAFGNQRGETARANAESARAETAAARAVAPPMPTKSAAPVSTAAVLPASTGASDAGPAETPVDALPATATEAATATAAPDPAQLLLQDPPAAGPPKETAMALTGSDRGAAVPAAEGATAPADTAADTGPGPAVATAAVVAATAAAVATSSSAAPPAPKPAVTVASAPVSPPRRTRKPEPRRAAAKPASSSPRRTATQPRALAKLDTPRPKTQSAACKALIQQASLQPLSAEDAALLKKECR